MKNIILSMIFVIFASSAFAGSCPIKITLIDKALTAGNVKNAEQVKTLRDKGEALHNSGDHNGSVTILTKAIKMGGIKSQTY